MRTRRRIGELFLAIALVAALAGCGGGSSSSSTSTTTTAAATTTTSTAGVKAAITTAWTTFFNGATPVAQRVALLAGGSKFSSTIKTLSKNPLASKTAATVSNIKVTGPKTATVTFSVSLSGIPVLTNVNGTAVLTDGKWLVDAASLCKLLSLEGGAAPSACH